MIRIPEHRAPMVFGVIQAGLTSLIASGIGVYRLSGATVNFFADWAIAWLSAWAAMIPVVIFAAPHIQRAVIALIRATNRG